MICVALVGPDGAGKSTVSRLLEREPLPAPVKTVYMGVNLDASRLMLPTTRLALAVKRARGGRGDLTASSGRDVPDPAGGAASRVRRALVRTVRTAGWIAEEWFRQAVATSYRRRGWIVVFDRHFFADYYHADVAPGDGRRPLSARLHGFMLRRLYPEPDLVVCLDAPGDVLFARKHEAGAQWLERRRAQYLELARVVPRFVVVDADRPVEVVTKDVARVISTCYDARRRP